MSVYIIAEIGVNHNGSIEIAKQMVDVAKDAGCDCVKFQTFYADKIVTQKAKQAKYQLENTGLKESQYEMLKRLELSYEEFKTLKSYCENRGIDFLSTPFDEEAVDLLENLGVNQYKISSGEITNQPLIKYIASKNKKNLVSTGMCTMEEVEEAVNWIREENDQEIILFHCTSNYPTPFHDVNMRAMLSMKEKFQTSVGYSDHTEGIEISLMAVAMGAVMIEKHFTLSRKMEGPDHKASLEPIELIKMVEGIRNIEKAFGRTEKRPTKEELKIREVARKSLVLARDKDMGEVLGENDIVCKRPGTGISPKYKDLFVNKKIQRDLKKDKLLSYLDIYEE